jgi:ankyrin repeat protein
LHFASSSGHAAVVQTLLQHGANVAATDQVMIVLLLFLQKQNLVL